MVVIPFPEPPPVLTLEALRDGEAGPALRWKLPHHPDFELLNAAIDQVMEFMYFLAMDPLHTGDIEGRACQVSELNERLVELMTARIAEIDRRVDLEREHDPVTPRKFLYERFARLADDTKHSAPEALSAISEPQIAFLRRAKPASFMASVRRLWNRLRYPRLSKIWGPLP